MLLFPRTRRMSPPLPQSSARRTGEARAQRWEPLSLPRYCACGPPRHAQHRRARSHGFEARDHPGTPLRRKRPPRRIRARRNHPGYEEALYVIEEAYWQGSESGATALERAEGYLAKRAQRRRTPALALEFFLNSPILAMIRNEDVAKILIDIVQEIAVEHAEDVADQASRTSRDDTPWILECRGERSAGFHNRYRWAG